MSALDKVAKRLADEVGLSQAASRRVAKRLNELAKSVPWATAVEPAPVDKNALASLAQVRQSAEAVARPGGAALPRPGGFAETQRDA